MSKVSGEADRDVLLPCVGFHNLCEGLLNGCQRCLDVGTVGLVTQHCKEFMVCRNDCALCQIGDLRRGDGVDVEADPLYAELVLRPFGNIKAETVQDANDAVHAANNGRDHAVHQTDDAIDGRLDCVRDAFPDVRHKVRDRGPGIVPALLNVGCCAVQCGADVCPEIVPALSNILPQLHADQLDS